MAWRIEYLRSVRKAVEQIDPTERRRIREFMEKRVATLDDPRTLAKPLKGADGSLWRYRVGAYRVVCEIHDTAVVVLVVRVGHRKEVYR